MSEQTIQQERIVSAAIEQHDDIYPGSSHDECIKCMVRNVTTILPEDWVYGFLTDRGNFVDREEAAEIAFKAGQINTKQRFLYSQDLKGEK